MSLHKDDAIIFSDVSKVYHLFQNQWQMLRHALGLKNKHQLQAFHALKNINFKVSKGERVGLIGRNGAGKSTLLKLITANFSPTSGAVTVNGSVQALMNMGVGFHPEFTGLENIKASLLYNGLTKQQTIDAIADIIDFVELGDFLEQPLKTYSLGMQSRLYFAVATAIQPEILIIDEVLGAGDAYFSAKSAERMEKLTGTGCSLLLVSHSMQQVLQFCERAIWIEGGEIVKEGNAIDVVKSYEQYTKKLEQESKKSSSGSVFSEMPSKWLQEKILAELLGEQSNKNNNTNLNTTEGGVSRWTHTAEGLIITSVKTLDKEQQVCSHFSPGEEVTFQVEFEAKSTGCYECYFALPIFNTGGIPIVRNRSKLYNLNLQCGRKYIINLTYSELLLGAGDYIFSVAIFKKFGKRPGESSEYYDLLSRSFKFSVKAFNDDNTSLFLHPALWSSEVVTSNKSECIDSA